MSFPNIPDINPDIDISLEGAVNLLLTSIALEEVSLSKLMDAETEKILSVLQDCKHKENTLHDTLLVNKSVDNTIKNIIKLQMLLQFKLEKVKEIIPSSSTTTTTSTSTSTTTTCTKTTTHTTTCTTSTYTTTTRKGCSCCLAGKGKGCVSNCCDTYYGKIAVLNASVFCNDIKNRTIRYSVDKDRLEFFASGYNIKIQCPHHNPSEIILYGKGHLTKKSNCKDVVRDTAKFKLKVCKLSFNELEFEMTITADNKSDLKHNSGLVRVIDYGSTLRFICLAT